VRNPVRVSVLAALPIFLFACQPTEQAPRGEAEPASQCLTPSPQFTEELRSFLTGGASFNRIAAYRSDAHQNAYYVAVHMTVPGAEGWALFAATAIDRFAATYAVDDIANDFSDLLDGRQTQARFSTRDPGARAAIDCL
jgi:hypothetical protein